jgi:hypothetical protein
LISALDPSTRSTFSANPEISRLLTSCLLPMFAWEWNLTFFFWCWIYVLEHRSAKFAECDYKLPLKLQKAISDR